jgi:bifunctional non-homologous end joining protein LigD
LDRTAPGYRPGGAALLKAQSFILDGESVVVEPNGLTDFEALRRQGARDVAVLYAFDLVELDGDDLRSQPIEMRKTTLAPLLRNPGTIRLAVWQFGIIQW